MWHQWFNRNFTNLREYFLCPKKKIMNLFNNLSPPRHPNNVCCSVSAACGYAVYVVYALISMSTTYPHIHCIRCLRMWYFPLWHYRVMWWRRVIFVFFAHKKYSCSFVKLWLNHWCHMKYFNDLLAKFMSLDRVRILAVYGGSESSRNALKRS